MIKAAVQVHSGLALTPHGSVGDPQMFCESFYAAMADLFRRPSA